MHFLKKFFIWSVAFVIEIIDNLTYIKIYKVDKTLNLIY